MTPDDWRRVSSTLDALLDVPESERAPRLEELRQRDPWLYGEVTSLLQEQEPGNHFAEPPVTTVGTALLNRMLRRSGLAQCDLPPHLPNISGYEVLEQIGVGGMGVVYKARHQVLNRLVALKMIRFRGHISTEERKRFHIEAEAAAQLHHANIVRVYDVGEQDGQPYLALEFIEGGSLSSALAGIPQPPLLAAEFVEKLARAIHYAHGRGIVHRDLKPANILLSASLGARPGAEPHVTDFGLAKFLEGDPGNTQTGVMMGTPSYMAPEQVSSVGRGSIGRAADTYALGAILYEMITGRPPFRGPTTTDTLFQVRHDDPLPPSRLQPKVSRDLETICLKCLRKEPERRYASAEELAEDLRRFRSGEAICARPVGRLERAVKWVKRRPAQAAALALGLLLLMALAAGGMSLLYTGRLAGERDRAQHANELAQEQKRIADQLRADAEQLRDYVEYVRSILQAQHDYDEGNYARAAEILDKCRWDMRGWEWANLRRSSLVHALEGHTDRVHAVAFSPDGRRLASGSDDGTVRLWDALTGTELRCLRGHKEGIRGLAFSPDGRLLASGGGKFPPTGDANDTVIRLWDVESGRELDRLTGHSKLVRSLCFSPDGTRLASASYDGTIRLWEMNSRKMERVLSEHASGVWCVDFSLDGHFLASGSADGQVRLWDARSGEPIQSFIGHKVGDDGNAGVGGISFSPDGRRLASAGDDRTVRIWDVKTANQLQCFEGNSGYVNCVRFSPDGRCVVSAGVDSAVRLWDSWTGERIGTFPGQTGEVRGVSFSPDGAFLAGACWDKVVRVWDMRIGQQMPFISSPAGAWSAVFSPDGQSLAGACMDGNLRLWDSRTGEELDSWRHDRGVLSTGFSPDGRRLASGFVELFIRNAQTGRLLHRLPPPGGGVRCLQVSPDGLQLLCSCDDGTPRLYDMQTGRLIASLLGHTDHVRAVCFSADGKQIITGSHDRTVRFWDAQTGKQTQVLQGHIDAVTSVACSPDGRLVASASGDRTVRLWDGRTGEEVRVLTGHMKTLHAVCFCADGRRLASASADGTVRIWDAQTGQEMRVLSVNSQGVASICFSPDGRELVSTSGDRGVRCWDTRGGPYPRIFGDVDGVSSVGLSSDGRRIVAGRAGVTSETAGGILCWDIATGHPVKDSADPAPPTNQRTCISQDGRLTVWIDRNQIKALRQEDVDQARRDNLAIEQEWRLRQALLAENDRDWYAVAFQLKHLLGAEKSQTDFKPKETGFLLGEKAVLEQMGARAFEDPERDAGYLAALGAVLYSLGAYETALELFERALNRSEP